MNITDIALDDAIGFALEDAAEVERLSRKFQDKTITLREAQDTLAICERLNTMLAHIGAALPKP